MKKNKYGAVDCGIWKHHHFKKLSDEAKLLSMYVRTNEHINMIGCFHLPMGYMMVDLGWSEQKCRKAIAELSGKGFLMVCDETEWVLLPKHLRKFPLKNPNMVKHALALHEEIPADFTYLYEITEIMMKDPFIDESVREQLANCLQTITKLLPNKIESVTKQNSECSLTNSSNNNNNNNSNNISGCSETKSNLLRNTSDTVVNLPKKDLEKEAKDILAFLNEKAGRNFQATRANLKFITGRLRDGATPEQCRQVIANRVREWKGDHKMAEYLRPETIFNETKFASYVGLLGADLPPPGEKNGKFH